MDSVIGSSSYWLLDKTDGFGGCQSDRDFLGGKKVKMQVQLAIAYPSSIQLIPDRYILLQLDKAHLSH